MQGGQLAGRQNLNNGDLVNRREALRLLAAGSALQLAPVKLLTALRQARTILGDQTAPRTLNAHEYETVKILAERIIPRTDTPGATDVGAVDFIDLMLTEWYDEPQRSRFQRGLADVDARSQSLFANNFVSCSAAQQAEILTALGESMTEAADRDPASSATVATEAFYPMLRRLTLTAYYTSEVGATQELHFEMIPGHFDGCTPEQSSAQNKDQGETSTGVARA